MLCFISSSGWSGERRWISRSRCFPVGNSSDTERGVFSAKCGSANYQPLQKAASKVTGFPCARAQTDKDPQNTGAIPALITVMVGGGRCHDRPTFNAPRSTPDTGQMVIRDVLI